MIRYYPAPEGTHDPSGKEYTILPLGEVRPELTIMLDAIRGICHTKGFNFIVESLNHGRHTPGSNHYRGIACDFNAQDQDKSWLTFDLQGALVAEAAGQTDLDVWIWKDDLSTHTHFSVHPNA